MFAVNLIGCQCLNGANKGSYLAGAKLSGSSNLTGHYRRSKLGNCSLFFLCTSIVKRAINYGQKSAIRFSMLCACYQLDCCTLGQLLYFLGVESNRSVNCHIQQFTGLIANVLLLVYDKSIRIAGRWEIKWRQAYQELRLETKLYSFLSGFPVFSELIETPPSLCYISFTAFIEFVNLPINQLSYFLFNKLTLSFCMSSRSFVFLSFVRRNQDLPTALIASLTHLIFN